MGQELWIDIVQGQSTYQDFKISLVDLTSISSGLYSGHAYSPLPQDRALDMLVDSSRGVTTVVTEDQSHSSCFPPYRVSGPSSKTSRAPLLLPHEFPSKPQSPVWYPSLLSKVRRSWIDDLDALAHPMAPE
jgi:hypothetical protein